MYARTGSEYEVCALYLGSRDLLLYRSSVLSAKQQFTMLLLVFYPQWTAAMLYLTAHLLSWHAQELSADILVYNCFKGNFQ